MGEAARRKRNAQGAQAQNIHEQIQIEAKNRRNTPESILTEFMLSSLPAESALGGLLEAAQVALNNATPTKFIYEGRPYWLRCCTGMALLEVFDSPAVSEPLVRTLTGSENKFGHNPGH